MVCRDAIDDRFCWGQPIKQRQEFVHIMNNRVFGIPLDELTTWLLDEFIVFIQFIMLSQSLRINRCNMSEQNVACWMRRLNRLADQHVLVRRGIIMVVLRLIIAACPGGIFLCRLH
ncbi:hypothetical protein CCR95_09705 [Thiocystis minor]|nr:hypothetical protein [Thiocystis minor]